MAGSGSVSKSALLAWHLSNQLSIGVAAAKQHGDVKYRRRLMAAS